MLNRLLGALAAAAVLVASVTVSAAAPAAARAPVRILIVGDSITHGTIGDWTWRYRLWKNLMAAGESVDFVGPHDGVLDPESGDREDLRYADPAFDSDHAARWGMGFATQEYPIADLVAEYQPDVVVEMLGTNDLAFFHSTPEDVAAAASEFVREARAVKPDVDVVLGQIVDQWVGGADSTNWWLDTIAADRDRPDARVVTADVPSSWVKDEDTYDPLHPSAVGEVKLAQSVAAALAELGLDADPDAFPDVVNGPAATPVLRARWTRDGVPRLTWTTPVGASGVYLWRRDLTAGEDWQRVELEQARVPLQPGQVVRWKAQAYKGSAVSPRFSRVVTVVGPPRVPAATTHQIRT